jgi:hypothetical protein
MTARDILSTVPKLLNDNQGVVSVAIFILTLFLGWVSGIFAALRRKPKFRLWLIPGPTLCTTFSTGKREGRDAHRTAISIYLGVANIGTAATSIRNVALGFHWDFRPFSLMWVKYRIFWDWIEHPLVTLDDFQTTLADQRRKIYPSLFQGSATLGTATDTHLETGKVVSGIVYFELDESWGGRSPVVRARQTRVRVAVEDAFGAKHKKSFWVPVVNLNEAEKFNPSFGRSLASLRKQSVNATAAQPSALPIDLRRLFWAGTAALQSSMREQSALTCTADHSEPPLAVGVRLAHASQTRTKRHYRRDYGQRHYRRS